MTTREMSASEHSQTAGDFLVASDREFAAGDHRRGSEKLYGAATRAVIAICQQRGWRYGSRRAMQQAVTARSREHDGPFLMGAFLMGGYTVANRFHENFFHDHLEDCDIEANRPPVHQFVARLPDFPDGG